MATTAAQTPVRTLLSKYTAIVDAIDQSADLTPEESKKLLKLLATAVLGQEADIATIKEASTHETNASINVLDPERWHEVLVSHLAVNRAETFLRTFFSRILSSREVGNSAETLLTGLSHLMQLAVLYPDLCDSSHFKAAARSLVTELLVQKESLNNFSPVAVAAFRGSLLEADMPDNMQRAYSHARNVEKLTTPSPQHGSRANAGKRKNFHQRGRGRGRGRGNNNNQLPQDE